jgi:protein TonB
MTHCFALLLAMLAQQATPATPQPSNPPAAQSAQQPAPTAPNPAQAVPTNPPSSSASQVYTIGGHVKAPIAIYIPVTEYTAAAGRAKITGSVTVEFIVDVQGRPTDVHVTRPIARNGEEFAEDSLNQAALDTVKKYRFKPGKLDGTPVPVRFNTVIRFDIQ